MSVGKYLPWDVKSGCGGEQCVCTHIINPEDGGDALFCEPSEECTDPFHDRFSKCDWATIFKPLANMNMPLWGLFASTTLEAQAHKRFSSEKMTKTKLFQQVQLHLRTKVDLLYPPDPLKVGYTIPGGDTLLKQYNRIVHAFEGIKAARDATSPVDSPVTELERKLDRIAERLDKITPTQTAQRAEVQADKQNLGNAVAFYAGRAEEGASSSSDATDVLILPQGPLGEAHSTGFGGKRTYRSVTPNTSSRVKAAAAVATSGRTPNNINTLLELGFNLLTESTEQEPLPKQPRIEPASVPPETDLLALQQEYVATLKSLDVTVLSEGEQAAHKILIAAETRQLLQIITTGKPAIPNAN